MTSCRWNIDAAARAYDEAAQFIHPHYVEIQDHLLSQLLLRSGETLLVIDAGGGSGRLMERVLDRLPHAEGLLLDQSEAHLALAANRLHRFGTQGRLALCRLQDDWTRHLDRHADFIISMSAIHHLEPNEKRTLYSRCHEYLAPCGQLLNGDEVRPPSTELYLAELRRWLEHMTRQMAAGKIPETFSEMLAKWHHRNIEKFDATKTSGEDCHETIDTQLGYLRDAGFTKAEVLWQCQMWAVLSAKKLE